jgi:hypothetical protein
MPPDKPLYGLLNRRFWSNFTISVPLLARLCRFLSLCPLGTAIVTADVICLQLMLLAYTRPSIQLHVTYCVKLYQLLNISVIETELTPCSKVPPRHGWLFNQPTNRIPLLYVSLNLNTRVQETATGIMQPALQHSIYTTLLLHFPHIYIFFISRGPFPSNSQTQTSTHIPSYVIGGQQC